MEKWTTDMIPSQDGRKVIITGANSGLGYYTALGLAQHGADVVMACRNKDKAMKAKKEILEICPEARLEVMELDLADLNSVRSFAGEFIKNNQRLDLLINNAGLMAIPYRKTVQGFEMQFGVNHLAHFALTGLLFPLISSTKGSRIITVASSAHRIGKMRFDDLNWEIGYKKWAAYGMSKLSNIHFTRELAERIEKKELSIIAAAAHPGYADSKLIEKGPEMKGRNLMVRAGRIANRIFAQSTAMGALPTLYAAVSPDVVRGGYYGPGGFAGMRGYPARDYPRSSKISKDDQVRLWNISKDLTGVSFLEY